PTALVEQTAQLAAVLAVLLDGVLIVDAGDEALIGDVEQREARSLVDAAALGFDDAILDLIAHAEAVAAADAIRFEQKFDLIFVLVAVEGDGPAFVEADGNFLGFDVDLTPPERRAHN